MCKTRQSLFSPCQVPCVRWLTRIPQIEACSAPVVIVKLFIGVTYWSFCCWGGWGKEGMVVASLSEARFNQTPRVLNSFAGIASSAAAVHVTNTNSCLYLQNRATFRFDPADEDKRKVSRIGCWTAYLDVEVKSKGSLLAAIVKWCKQWV